MGGAWADYYCCTAPVVHLWLVTGIPVRRRRYDRRGAAQAISHTDYSQQKHTTWAGSGRTISAVTSQRRYDRRGAASHIDYSQQKHTTWAADNYCSAISANCLSCTAPVVPPLTGTVARQS